MFAARGVPGEILFICGFSLKKGSWRIYIYILEAKVRISEMLCHGTFYNIKKKKKMIIRLPLKDKGFASGLRCANRAFVDLSTGLRLGFWIGFQRLAPTL